MHFNVQMSVILFDRSQGNGQLFLGIGSVLTGYVIIMYMQHATYYVEHKTFINAFIVTISANYIQHTGRPTVAKFYQSRISSVGKVN